MLQAAVYLTKVAQAWLNNVKGLFPEPGKTREQNKAETVMLGEQRSFHLTTEDDEDKAA